MKALLRCLVSGALTLGTIPTATLAAGEAEDQVVDVAKDDAAMNAAIQKARDSLDEFLSIAEAPPAGADGFKLKVLIRDGDAGEHFWVIPFQRTANGFEGILANEPQSVSNVVYGQQISFTRDDISDWGYTRDGRQVGNFTVCVLFTKMPKADADRYRSDYGFDC